MKKAPLLFLLALACHTARQKHTDLGDAGYRGPVKQLITHNYSDIVQVNGQWIPKDSASPASTISETFNREGDYLQRIIQSPGDTSTFDYSYVNGIKTGWTNIRSNGKAAETALFRYYGTDSITETTTYPDDNSQVTNTYILRSDGHTARLVDRGYDSEGKPLSHLIYYNEDDPQGHYWRIRTVDQLNHSTEIMEFNFPEKDSLGNPLRILLLKDKETKGMRVVGVEYYE